MHTYSHLHIWIEFHLKITPIVSQFVKTEVYGALGCTT